MADLSLESLSMWSGIPYNRLYRLANLEADWTQEEQVRVRTISSLYLALRARVEIAREVLEETYGKHGQNGSVR